MALNISIAQIQGTKGNDRITGTDRTDIIWGDDGVDVIEGLGGADLIHGDAGSDTVSYASSGAAGQVSLQADTVQHGGDAEGDQLFSIENVIGSVYNDTIGGNGLSNRLEGGNGIDTLYGFGGNDTLIGGLDGSADTINGGSGCDTVDYSAGTLGMTITLGSTTGSAGTAMLNDYMMPFTMASGQVVNIPRAGWQEDVLSYVENVIGTQGADTITGSSADNRIEGRSGDDVINSGDGNDFIVGGLGADELDGRFGQDTFVYTDYRDSGMTWTASGVIQHGQDTILGFEAGIDRIDLSAIDADPTRSGNPAFHWVDEFTGAPGELRAFEYENPQDNIPGFTAPEADTTGDTNVDMIIYLLAPTSLDVFFQGDVIL